MARLLAHFRSLIPELSREIGEGNPNALPHLEKVVVSSGVGRASVESGQIEQVASHLAMITGQKPVITRARKSVASFKLRKGMPIGLKVTLRGVRMYEFLDRLIQVTLPRVRDFRGLDPGAFDPQGNYSIGLSEITVFPEASSVEVAQSHGLQITLVTTTRDRSSG